MPARRFLQRLGQRLKRVELHSLVEELGLGVSITSRKAGVGAALAAESRTGGALTGEPARARRARTKGHAADHQPSPSNASARTSAPPVPDLRPGGPRPVPRALPWGYGETRVRALARDPRWLYVYWEATDQAITAARERLGPCGGTAWFVLRVYDTSYRLFDGTNANSYFDVPVERGWNNYFIDLNRPRSAFHVEIGMKSTEGFFAAMARSGAAEMPANGVAGSPGGEWMTVLPSAAAPQPPSYTHRFVPGAPPDGHRARASAPSGASALQHFTSGGTWIAAPQTLPLFASEIELGEWFEQITGGTLIRWVRWQGTRQQFSWSGGPVRLGEMNFGPVEIWFSGPQAGSRSTWGAQTAELGSWHILITGLAAHGGRRLLGSWMVRMSGASGAAHERVDTPVLYRRLLGAYGHRSVVAGASEVLIREEMGASQELMAGASERLWLGSSELLLGAASETLVLGGSEMAAQGASLMAWFGASEVQWLGASEVLARGASEQWLAGASEVVFGGASGLGGASEYALGGASRLAFGGATEQLFLGGSEWVAGISSAGAPLGASELLGASEMSSGPLSDAAPQSTIHDR